jgi:hypothetical protein
MVFKKVRIFLTGDIWISSLAAKTVSEQIPGAENGTKNIQQ